MAFLPGYSDKLSNHDRARYLRKIEECGCDPYDLIYDELQENKKDWPHVTDVDRMEYLVFRTNFTTKEAMKNYKSLEAHNFFTSNLVFPPRVKVLSEERVIVLGKTEYKMPSKYKRKPGARWYKDYDEETLNKCLEQIKAEEIYGISRRTLLDKLESKYTKKMEGQIVFLRAPVV